MKTFFRWFWWVLRGKPMREESGMWCGLCGDWVEGVTQQVRDYQKLDNLYHRNTICPKCAHAGGKP
jgi:hypothetical protein